MLMQNIRGEERVLCEMCEQGMSWIAGLLLLLLLLIIIIAILIRIIKTYGSVIFCSLYLFSLGG